MSDVKRFFSLSDWGYDYNFQEFSSEEEARDSIQATADAARAWPDGTEWYDRLVWGEIRGVAREDGQLIPVPPTPDPEVERLQAKLDALRAAMRSLVVFLVEEGKQSRANLQTGPQPGQIVRVVHESGYHLRPKDRPPMDGQVGIVFGHATHSGIPCVCIEFGRCRMTLPVGDVEAVDQAERRWEELATQVCALLTEQGKDRATKAEGEG